MSFRNRIEAGRALAERLAPLVTGPAVVAAIPRGGVEVALPIVERLRLPLTLAYARKLTAPIAPELAFGAVDEDGHAITDAGTVAQLGLTPADVAAAKSRVAGEIARRMALYRVPPLGEYLPGRAVILVDDGLATGLTMQAAVAYARRHGARDITVAVPCASGHAARLFGRLADRVVSLIVDEDFMAVGQYYEDFSPVSDDRVCALLAPPAPPLRISFQNRLGLRLAGELLLPSSVRPAPAVVFAHGWGSSKASPRNRAAAEVLRTEGIAAFLFDFTGHGDSEGTEADSTESQHVADLREAIDTLAGVDDVDPHRVAVVGASSGAAAAVVVAAERPDLRALVLRSANLGNAAVAVPRVRVPTLLIVGELDAAIRDANEGLVEQFGGERRLVVVEGGDHLFEDPDALRQATAHTVAWCKRYLGERRRAGRSAAA